MVSQLVTVSQRVHSSPTAMQLDSIIPSFLEVLSTVGEPVHDVVDVVLGGSSGLVKLHPSQQLLRHLELHIRSRNRCCGESIGALPSRMVDLSNAQTSMGLRRRRHSFESLKPLSMERRRARNHRVASSLQMLKIDENVASQDDSETTLAPSLVQVDELGGGDPAGFNVDGVP